MSSKRHLVFLAAGVALAGGAFIFLRAEKARETAAATRHAESAAGTLNSQREILKARLNERSVFIAKTFPLPRKKEAAYLASLEQLQSLSFTTQEDFDFYDQTQSRISSRLAEEIAKVLKVPAGRERLQIWIKRLEEVDRASDEARMAYVKSAREARTNGQTAPTFRADDQILPKTRP